MVIFKVEKVSRIRLGDGRVQNFRPFLNYGVKSKYRKKPFQKGVQAFGKTSIIVDTDL